MSNGFNRKFNNLSSERGGTFKSQFFGKLQRRKLQAWSKFHFMLALCHSVCALWCTSGTLEHCKGVVYFNCADVTQVTHGFQMLQYFSWKGFWLELESTFHPCQGGDYANSKTLEIRAVASILWLAEGYSRKAKKRKKSRRRLQSYADSTNSSIHIKGTLQTAVSRRRRRRILLAPKCRGISGVNPSENDRNMRNRWCLCAFKWQGLFSLGIYFIMSCESQLEHGHLLGSQRPKGRGRLVTS